MDNKILWIKPPFFYYVVATAKPCYLPNLLFVTNLEMLAISLKVKFEMNQREYYQIKEM